MHYSTKLRKLIADDLLIRKNVCVSEDNIMITNGSKQALFYSIQIIINPGDEVIIHTPYWNSYQKLVEMQGGVIKSLLLEKNGNFPPLLVHMVASGENSGRLDHMLDKAASATENEMQTRISMMVSLLGPLMILVMGSLVFTIVMAILMPIFNLNSMLDY